MARVAETLGAAVLALCLAGSGPGVAAGKPAPDGLGTRLPAALPSGTIVDLLVPPEERRMANLIGAKPWPGQADGYVAIVCTGGAKPDPDLPLCAAGGSLDPAPPLHVYLGVLQAKPGEPPRLLARAGPISGALDWEHTNLPSPGDAGSGEGQLQPQSFERFDLAPYAIAAGQPAFGLRGRWDEPSAGGLAVYRALYLFTVDGGQLRQVLAAPISAFEDLPGPSPGATREHSEQNNVLVVTQHLTDGHFDLTIRAASGRWHQVYRWSKPLTAYRAAGG